MNAYRIVMASIATLSRGSACGVRWPRCARHDEILGGQRLGVPLLNPHFLQGSN